MFPRDYQGRDATLLPNREFSLELGIERRRMRTRQIPFFALIAGVTMWIGSCAGFVAARNAITPATISVSGHYRSGGTWVRPYKRRPAGSRKRDYPYELAAWVAAIGCGAGVLITLAHLERTDLSSR